MGNRLCGTTPTVRGQHSTQSLKIVSEVITTESETVLDDSSSAGDT